MGKSLYDIAQSYVDIISEIDENDGCVTEELDKKLQITEEELENKLRAYRHVIQTQDKYKEYNKDEIKRLRDRNTTFDNAKERLFKYIIPALHMFGTQTKSGNYNLKFADFSVSTRMNNSVIVNQEKIQSLLDAETGLSETTRDHYNLTNNQPHILDKLGLVEVSFKIPFSELRKFRDRFINDSTAGAVWNLSKSNLKELMEQRAELYRRIDDGNGSNQDIDDADDLNEVLEYIEARVEGKETVNFK